MQGWLVSKKKFQPFYKQMIYFEYFKYENR